MPLAEQLFSFVYQYADNAAFLILTAVGLILIFGMMGVINMAHGELMMIGAYVTAYAYHKGVPVVFAVVLAGLTAALAGIILERLIVRRFYGQLLSSLVVTWGLSLVLSQGFLIVFGPSVLNIPTPFGSFQVGDLSFGWYRLVLFAVSLALIAAVWVLFTFTSFGRRARATMERPEMAEALGIDTRVIYSATFGIGSALAGIAGGMFAMTATISPFFGLNYTPLAFITVVVGGGASALMGLVSSVTYLAGVQTVTVNLFNQYVGYVSIMAAAMLALVLFPNGISTYLESFRKAK